MQMEMENIRGMLIAQVNNEYIPRGITPASGSVYSIQLYVIMRGWGVELIGGVEIPCFAGVP